MHFRKAYPTENGYYWFIDLDHAVPRIGFVQGDTMHHEGSLYHEGHTSTKRFIRIGDLIEQPTVGDNTHE